MEKETDNSPENMAFHTEPEYEFPLADTISLPTIVNLLIRKGIISEDELIEAESKNLELPSPEEGRPEPKGRRRRGPEWKWLKQLMSKRRITRRLGTLLFGWRWKKVRITVER